MYLYHKTHIQTHTNSQTHTLAKTHTQTTLPTQTSDVQTYTLVFLRLILSHFKTCTYTLNSHVSLFFRVCFMYGVNIF